MSFSPCSGTNCAIHWLPSAMPSSSASNRRNDPASRRWASEVIDRQSSQLTRMVDDLLDVERINRGRIELRPEPLELNGSALPCRRSDPATR